MEFPTQRKGSKTGTHRISGCADSFSEDVPSGKTLALLQETHTLPEGKTLTLWTACEPVRIPYADVWCWGWDPGPRTLAE